MHKQKLNSNTILLGTVLLVCGFIAFWFCCYEPLKRDTKALPKISPLPLDPALFFSRYYADLEKALSEQLLPLGLELNEVSTHPTHKDGVALWPQKIIEIPVPEQLSQEVLINALRKALDRFAPAVTFHAVHGIASSEFSVTIFISQFPSHKLLFFRYTDLNLVKRKIARAAIIIDDIGNNFGLSMDVLGIKAPITLSILPFSQHAQSIAFKAHASGHEIMLHLPMEAKNGKLISGDAVHSRGFLLTEMNNQEIAKQTGSCIEAVPYIAGVNNHMGSRFTEDDDKMEIVLSLVRERGLFYIDSLTTEQSKGFKVARKLGIKAGKRDIFLDNDESYLSTVNQLEQLIMLAISRGTALGIGHPYPSTIHAINTMVPEFEKRGIEIVPVSKLLE